MKALIEMISESEVNILEHENDLIQQSLSHSNIKGRVGNILQKHCDAVQTKLNVHIIRNQYLLSADKRAEFNQIRRKSMMYGTQIIQALMVENEERIKIVLAENIKIENILIEMYKNIQNEHERRTTPQINLLINALKEASENHISLRS